MAPLAGLSGSLPPLPSTPSIGSEDLPSVGLRLNAPQSLTYSTIFGGPAGNYWDVAWRLSQPSQSGGFIVQEITRTLASGANYMHYWEAWEVKANKSVTIYYASFGRDDMFRGGPSGSFVFAQARFYEGLSLPSSFVPYSVPAAGILPATFINPNLPINNATSSINRVWGVP